MRTIHCILFTVKGGLDNAKKTMLCQRRSEADNALYVEAKSEFNRGNVER